MNNGAKKNLTNAAIGLVSQILIILIGFVVPRIYLSSYGSDTNGLTNTIAQIFGYVALLEAGVAQATRNALYPKISAKDNEGISNIASLAKSYYRKVSLIYGIVVLVLAFVLPFVLKTKVDFPTIFFLVLFEGLSGVVSFYFVSTWTCIISSFGNTSFINVTNLCVKLASSIAKIALALCGLNVALVQLSYFAITCLQTLFYFFYMRKYFPWIQYNRKPADIKLGDRKYYVITEIAWTIFSSTDMIVLATVLSTEAASVYSVYNLVFTSLGLVLNAVFHSVSYLLGQTYQKGIKSYSKMHDNFNSVMMSICTVLMSVAVLLCVPFIRLYTNGVEDTNYIYIYLPMLFAAVQILSWSRQTAGNLTGLAGYARPTSFVSLVEAALNISFSFLLVAFSGIYGVILATLCALPVKVIYVNYIAEKKVMKRSAWKTLFIYLYNYAIFAATAFFSVRFPFNLVNTYWDFILWASVFTFAFGAIVFAGNMLINRNMLSILKGVLRHDKH